MTENAGYKFKGEDTLYLVDAGDGLMRPFDQTDGSTSFDIDELEVATKDRQGTDYGDITEVRSFEGQLVKEDPFIPAIKDAIRNKRFVEIWEVNVVTKEAEKGMHMISDFEMTHAHGDFAEYSLEARLFGEVTTEELEEIPEGAPELELGGDDNNGGGVEG